MLCFADVTNRKPLVFHTRCHMDVVINKLVADDINALIQRYTILQVERTNHLSNVRQSFTVGAAKQSIEFTQGRVQKDEKNIFSDTSFTIQLKQEVTGEMFLKYDGNYKYLGMNDIRLPLAMDTTGWTLPLDGVEIHKKVEPLKENQYLITYDYQNSIFKTAVPTIKLTFLVEPCNLNGRKILIHEDKVAQEVNPHKKVLETYYTSFTDGWLDEFHISFSLNEKVNAFAAKPFQEDEVITPFHTPLEACIAEDYPSNTYRELFRYWSETTGDWDGKFERNTSELRFGMYSGYVGADNEIIEADSGVFGVFEKLGEYYEFASHPTGEYYWPEDTQALLDKYEEQQA